MNEAVGYAKLIRLLGLHVRPIGRPASVSSAVNRRKDEVDGVLFPRGVAVEDSPLGHLEFAIRHEGVNLEVIDAAFEHIEPGHLVGRLRQAPNGEYIRRLCYLWEWSGRPPLEAGVSPSGGYVDLLSADEYAVAGNPIRVGAYRINDNALGNADFCPMVRRADMPSGCSIEEFVAMARNSLPSEEGLRERVLHYLYLSETRGSFAIENEKPTHKKEDRFVGILRSAGEARKVDESWLARIQNEIVRDAYSQEGGYRSQQNWLEDASGRISFLPPAPEDLGRLMKGWESFVNDDTRQIDPLVKAACGAFGFVYLHPFMDGNGRLHRFMLQRLLAQAGFGREGLALPVSAVILKNIPEYLDVLKGFSVPVTALWDYRIGNHGPLVVHSPGARPYRFFDAGSAVGFTYRMLAKTVEDEIPSEVEFLRGYDEALSKLEANFDLPQKDMSALVRMIHGNDGVLSINRRKQFSWIPEEALDRIEQIVRESFDGVAASPAADKPKC